MRKRKHERIYTCEQWMNVIKQARVRKPFRVVACERDMFLDWQVHFSSFFKKAIKNSKKHSLAISNARALEYCSTHSTEVWVKYNIFDAEWHKFPVLKRSNTPTLPDPHSSCKYSKPVELKEKKAIDLKKIVDKYIPTEFQGYYNNILSYTAESDATDE